MKRGATAALVLAGLAGMATPAAAGMVIQTTISGYTSSGFDSYWFDLPDTGGFYSLVLRQQFPDRDLESVPNVTHNGINGTLLQVTFNYAGQAWTWFDIYQPGPTGRFDGRDVLFWDAREPLAAQDPDRNLQFYFKSAITEDIGQDYYGMAGELDMSNVFLPMTFIDWSSGYPVGEITIEDFDIDLVGFYRFYIGCYYDGCRGARTNLNAVYTFRSDIRHVKVESFALPGGGPVPEPGAWALMIAGFGLVGHALRRRERATA